MGIYINPSKYASVALFFVGGTGAGVGFDAGVGEVGR
jgi:hypothetical protein